MARTKFNRTLAGVQVPILGDFGAVFLLRGCGSSRFAEWVSLSDVRVHEVVGERQSHLGWNAGYIVLHASGYHRSGLLRFGISRDQLVAIDQHIENFHGVPIVGVHLLVAWVLERLSDLAAAGISDE